MFSITRLSLAVLLLLFCSSIATVAAQPANDVAKAKAPVRAFDSQAAIEGQWIVRAAGDIDGLRRGLPDFVKSAPGLSRLPSDLDVSLDVLYTYNSAALRGVSVKFNLASKQGRALPAEERRNYHAVIADVLAGHSQILDIEQDQKVEAWGDFSSESTHHEVDTMGKPTPRPPTVYPEPTTTNVFSLPTDNKLWGLDRIDVRTSRSFDFKMGVPATGAGVTVYVIDTGVHTSHEQFQTESGSRASWGASFVEGSNGDDGNGHGTHCAGTIGGNTVGVARDANIVAVQVLDSQGDGSYASVLAGVNWIVENAQKPAVVSMSLGGPFSQTNNNALAAAIATGITFVVAAGNDAANACNFSPASTPTAITVGSTDKADAISYFSNIGSCVSLFAPGTGIYSSWKNTDTDYATISGTSMATPHVAGTVALYLQQNPSASPAQVKSDLLCFSTKGAISRVKRGTTNALLYTKVGTAPLGTATCYA